MRAFVAIELPDHLRSALAREQARLRALCPLNRDIRWTACDSMHLTLKFLGKIALDRVPAVIAALQSINLVAALEVEVRGFGFFPDARRPQVFWAGLEAPPLLGDLAQRIDAAIVKLGFPAESRPFGPHLTLARFRTPRADPALLKGIENAQSVSVGHFKVDEFFLFESRLLPGGAEHTKVARFRLR